MLSDDKAFVELESCDILQQICNVLIMLTLLSSKIVI